MSRNKPLWAEQPRIQGDGRFRANRNPGGVGMVGIDDSVRVAPAGDDARNEE